MEAEAREAVGMLAVDVGNTVTRLGLFADDGLAATWEVTTPEHLTIDEARLVVAGFHDALERRATGGEPPLRAGDSIVSCVVPDLTGVWASALLAECGRRPLVVGPGLKTGIKMRYRDPAEVGPDRVADLAAALADYGGPLVVVDLGTTTNFEVIDAEGTFRGGIIAPGLALGAKALAQAAARLPHVELKAPTSVIGTSTREAVQAGVVMGEVARIDGLVDKVEAELGCEAEVVVTGADAAAMAALLAHEARADDTLTLRGLHRLYELNRKKP
ncbi:type III pantothenate kinase [Gordonibacter massiliensis (ex Traore et al. 2017)]|uniref:type III pantothenate kinase n=1 Tax=Gordonibacter massiliensis (ex Traore et al. 2017) TaxID=1841863 RepID=UPI001C8C9412|nr:type III pantothenate kinase [Gordonibacter massiliensis (ex Traore et al. 2017)]MBX9033132.1 type III pantothenate kinase [Gordonibacter massiliensis (ex Traore et al. 2017)]